jgi:hypothetical protein
MKTHSGGYALAEWENWCGLIYRDSARVWWTRKRYWKRVNKRDWIRKWLDEEIHQKKTSADRVRRGSYYVGRHFAFQIFDIGCPEIGELPLMYIYMISNYGQWLHDNNWWSLIVTNWWFWQLRFPLWFHESLLIIGYYVFWKGIGAPNYYWASIFILSHTAMRIMFARWLLRISYNKLIFLFHSI